MRTSPVRAAYGNCISSITSLLSFALLLALNTGCVSVSTKSTVQPIVDAIKNAKPPVSNESEKFATAPGAVSLRRMEDNARQVTNQLTTAGLYKLSSVKKLVAAAQTQQPLKLSGGEIRTLARNLLDTMHTNIFSGGVRTSRQWQAHAEKLEKEPAMAVAASKGNLDVFTLLEAYFLAYANGNFTLRDGTVMGKPAASLVFTNGTFQGAIPNDTVDGIVTLFVEALSDTLFQTPLFYQTTITTTYTNYYTCVTNAFQNVTGDGTNSFIQLARPSVSIQHDFFLGGKVPTAAKFLSCSEVVTANPVSGIKTRKGLRRQEVQFVRAVSGLTAKQSQALGALIFQSFGGGAAGQFVFLHISVGNNRVLASIVDNLLSSFSYHSSEWALTDAFSGYPGNDPVVEALLNHYQDLIAIVTK